MISNEERREVARKLRERTKKPMGKSMQRMFTDTLGIYAHHISWMNPDKATNRWDVIVNYLADLIEPQPIDGNTSDGYHTFDELYHHRAVLFSVIVENFATRAWKSKLHADGTMYEGMFIVGIETPDGQATYHYDVEPYWDMFRCKEIDRAPEWDGHTPDQAIERIGKLVDCKTDRPTCRNIAKEVESRIKEAEDGGRMISEKDRSEAVTSLRLALSYMRDYEDWYKANDSLFKCGNAAYREIAAAVCKGRRQGSYFDTVKRIIELAERPKSVMKSLGDLKFEGKMRRMRCLNCGAVHWELATKTVRFSHCPYCGIAIDRFIEEEDRDERA